MKIKTVILVLILSLIAVGCGKDAKLSEAPLTTNQRYKNYSPEDYMKYGIISQYFLEEDTRGYELVISQFIEYDKDCEVDEGRDVKVFVSQRSDDQYILNQILDNPRHDGAAWDKEGLYLIDVNFDGSKDILVQNGHYGAQGAVEYSCYIYNQGRYESCESFSNIPNASIDRNNEMILGYWRNHAVSHSNAMYVYDGDKYIIWRVITMEMIANPEDGKEAIWQWTDQYVNLDIETYLYGETDEDTFTKIEQFTSLNYDEETTREKLYGPNSFWQLGQMVKWNSLGE